VPFKSTRRSGRYRPDLLIGAESPILELSRQQRAGSVKVTQWGTAIITGRAEGDTYGEERQGWTEQQEGRVQEPEGEAPSQKGQESSQGQ